MEKLSVAIATFNEEENIEGCLSTVVGWADEIVVADGGSTDKTVETAKKLGARIILTDNPPIFHINKQKAINACSGEWILQLDADERVTPELKKEIEKVIIDEIPINGYWIPRKNFFLGRFLTKGGQYPDYTLRLYRRGKGYLPCKSVHEQAVVDGEIGYLKNPLIHMADPTFSRYLVRFDRYTNLLAKEIKASFAQKSAMANFFEAINWLMVKSVWWFLLTFFRHKGFMDSWQGFLFSFFSSLRFPVAFIKSLREVK